MQSLMGEWFRRHDLRAEEWEEVRQEAWLGFLRAVNAYADGRQKGRGPARFRTFMNLVVWSHLSTWDRQRRRAELHYDRSADWVTVLDRSARRTPGDLSGLLASHPRADDPADLAVRQEFRAQLTAEVERLGSTQRWFLEQRVGGRSLRDLAKERGLSYDQAKRFFRQVVGLLRQAIR
jgi:hypothetical protein